MPRRYLLIVCFGLTFVALCAIAVWMYANAAARGRATLRPARIAGDTIVGAIDKYYEAHRTLPSELEQLRPQFVETLPDSPGGPWQYRRVNERDYVIFCDVCILGVRHRYKYYSSDRTWVHDSRSF